MGNACVPETRMPVGKERSKRTAPSAMRLQFFVLIKLGEVDVDCNDQRIRAAKGQRFGQIAKCPCDRVPQSSVPRTAWAIKGHTA